MRIYCFVFITIQLLILVLHSHILSNFLLNCSWNAEHCKIFISIISDLIFIFSGHNVFIFFRSQCLYVFGDNVFMFVIYVIIILQFMWNCLSYHNDFLFFFFPMIVYTMVTLSVLFSLISSNHEPHFITIPWSLVMTPLWFWACN